MFLFIALESLIDEDLVGVTSDSELLLLADLHNGITLLASVLLSEPTSLVIHYRDTLVAW